LQIGGGQQYFCIMGLREIEKRKKRRVRIAEKRKSKSSTEWEKRSVFSNLKIELKLENEKGQIN